MNLVRRLGLGSKGLLCAGLAVVLVCLFVFAASDLFARSVAKDPNATLPQEELLIETGNGEFTFSAEIADDPDERSQGLMFREQMLPTHGMLFDFGWSEPVIMWMKNTPLALDMVFVREDGTVARVASNTVPFSLDHIPSGEPVAFVLELNAGIAAQIGLKKGDVIRHRKFGNVE